MQLNNLSLAQAISDRLHKMSVTQRHILVTDILYRQRYIKIRRSGSGSRYAIQDYLEVAQFSGIILYFYSCYIYILLASKSIYVRASVIS